MLLARRRSAAVLLFGGSALATLLASCALPGSASGSTNHAGGAALIGSPGAPAHITITPSDEAQGIALDTPVAVTVASGRLTSVTFQEAGAGPIDGQMAPDGSQWNYAGGLASHAHYVLDATAVGDDGKTVSSQASFGTLTAQQRLLTNFSPSDGSTVGVGETIDLSFNASIPASRRAALLQRIQVMSTPGVIGAWHWLDDSDVHFRTRDYWPSGTHVTVTANLLGFDAGSGVWGLGNWSMSFTVGPKHVSVIDSNTHQMQVYNNDQLIYTWPVSLGKPGFETLQGTLIVLYKLQVVKMQSCNTFGGAACVPGSANYYNDNVYWDTAVSSTGFYIHAAPWSVGSQGYANVSHGCINLSTARAITFFNWSQEGDVAIVKNTGNEATYASGEGDWQIDFSQYSNTDGFGTVWTGPPGSPSVSGRVY
jgi:lipoprotein-anchoring transpeptidase ErfK/SrfK